MIASKQQLYLVQSHISILLSSHRTHVEQLMTAECFKIMAGKKGCKLKFFDSLKAFRLGNLSGIERGFHFHNVRMQI